MRVVQEPESLNARVIRWTALGLVAVTVVCCAGAAALLLASAGTLAPAGSVAARELQTLREIGAVELGLFATLTARGERGTERPGDSPVSLPAASGSARIPLEAALRAYAEGQRPPRLRRDSAQDPDRLEPGVIP